ncbi:MAG: DUF2029 domain-containing protein [Chloroflexi bacterium]|nr:DUF2029 domain-containing protein [Chloroflexota bacterium]
MALATSLKLYPGVLVLYLIMRREWRALAAFALGLVGYGLVGMLLTSLQDTWTYFTRVLPNPGGTTAWMENQTLSGFVARLLTDRIRLESFAADLPARALKLSVLNYAVGALVIGLVLGLSYIRRKSQSQQQLQPPIRSGSSYTLGFASLLSATIFVLPAAWLHYYVAFLLSLAVAFYCLQADGGYWWLHSPRLVTASVVCLGLGTVLLMFGNVWFFYNRDNFGGVWKLLLSYKFYGAVVFWAGLVMMQ